MVAHEFGCGSDRLRNSFQASYLQITNWKETSSCHIIFVDFRIFDKYPQYLEKFDALKTIPVSELKTNQEFLGQCDRIGRAVEMVVENLDKPDALITALKNLGKRHIKYKVFREHFLVSENLRCLPDVIYHRE